MPSQGDTVTYTPTTAESASGDGPVVAIVTSVNETLNSDGEEATVYGLHVLSNHLGAFNVQNVPLKGDLDEQRQAGGGFIEAGSSTPVNSGTTPEPEPEPEPPTEPPTEPDTVSGTTSPTIPSTVEGASTSSATTAP